MTDVALALARHLERVATAAESAGRAAEDVVLIGVCKRQPIENIRAAWDAGLHVLGENTVQGLTKTAEALLPEQPAWHFVGRLQRNKVATLLRYRPVIHSVDRTSLAQAISAQAQKQGIDVDVLIQVNQGLEAQKGGVMPDAVVDFASAVDAMPGLNVRGLMTLPPHHASPTHYFERLASLGLSLQKHLPAARELSMGMSGDFEQAIACGATMVRIGEGIFGARVS